jgi:hypothetical protein
VTGCGCNYGCASVGYNPKASWFGDKFVDSFSAGASMCSESFNVTSSSNTASQAYDIGAIVGGTVGGVTALMIALYAIWRSVCRINHNQVNECRVQCKEDKRGADNSYSIS